MVAQSHPLNVASALFPDLNVVSPVLATRSLAVGGVPPGVASSSQGGSVEVTNAPEERQYRSDDDSQVTETRFQVLTRVASRVQSTLSAVFVVPPPEAKDPYDAHPLVQGFVGSVFKRASPSLSHDQSVRKIILDPLDSALESGAVDKKFFSSSFPTTVKVPFLSHAHILPGVAVPPKDVSLPSNRVLAQVLKGLKWS